jgi:uncharacterized protein
MSITLYVDADACPVKPEIYRVVERHIGKGLALKVFIVANSFINTPRESWLTRVQVSDGFDAADNWIAERVGGTDIVITTDVPLAHRCVTAGATVIAPNGKPFTPNSIGMALATRDLMQTLRESGGVSSGPAPFGPRDRSAFLSALDQAIVRLGRAARG